MINIPLPLIHYRNITSCLWDWSQIGIKLRSKYVIYQGLVTFLYEKNSCVNRLESVIFYI